MSFNHEDVLIGERGAVVLVDERARSRAVVVPSRGALVTSLVAHGREWLYLDGGTFHDAAQNVRGGIPVLFPSPGRLSDDRWTSGDRVFSMKQHGFARTRAFDEVSRGVDDGAWVELALEDDDASRASFPFAFALRIRFALRGATLAIVSRVENRGAEPMPFALGFHPYFAVPQVEKAATRIPTAAKRAWDNVEKRERPLGVIDLAAREIDLHLVDHGSQRARLEAPRGAVTLAGDFERWVIWTLEGKDFVCLEPWTAPADALNGHGACLLSPGESRSFGVTVDVAS